MNGWESKKLSEICKVNYGQSPTLTLSEEGNIPVIGTGNEIRYGEKFLYDGESIILGRKGTIDNPIYVSGKFWAIDTAFYLSNILDADVKWLYYYLLSRKSYFVSEATGVPSISRSFLYDLEINTPPKNEQTAIAQILSIVDKAIEQTEILIAKYQRIKTGLMQDLLTKGIDEQGNIRSEKTHKFKNSPLGRIPVEWEIVIFSEHIDLIHGYQFRDYDFTSNGIPVIKIGQITENGIDLSSCSYISTNRLDEFRDILLKNGDVLMALTGATLGKVCLVENINSIMLQNYRVGRFEPIKLEEFYKLYIYYAITQNTFLAQILNLVNTGAQGNIGKSDFNKILIKKPKHEEQKLISEKLIGIDNTIDNQKIYLSKLSSLKTGLMQDLLTGKVRIPNKLIDDTNSMREN